MRSATTTLCLLLLPLSAGCTFFRETLPGVLADVTEPLFGQKQVLAFESRDAETLSTPAFASLDATLPDTLIPRVFVVVSTAKMEAAVQQLSAKHEKLQVHLEDAPRLVRERVAALAAARNWDPVANEAVEAAANTLGIRSLADAMQLPEQRRAIGEQLGKQRKEAIGQVLFAEVEFGKSETNNHKGQFRMTLRLQSLSDEAQWTAESRCDKDLPLRGLFNDFAPLLNGVKIGSGVAQSLGAPR